MKEIISEKKKKNRKNIYYYKTNNNQTFKLILEIQLFNYTYRKKS